MSHYELPLYKDQINSDEWAYLSDYIYAPHTDYYVEKMMMDIKSHCFPFSGKHDIGSEGVIFCGQNRSITDCFRHIPEDGNYILVTRDNDHSITEDIYRKKPKSIKHWFAINCQVKHPDITAIPVGLATTGGWNGNVVIEIENHIKRPVDTRIFSRLTLTPNTHDRVLALALNRDNPLVKIIDNNIPGDEFCRHVIDHEFVLAPIGEGADCLRMNESVAMGAIPICTDCPEIKQFEDLPIVFTNNYNFTNEWLDEQKKSVEGKSTERLRMSYWRQQMRIKKFDIGIYKS